MGPSPCAGAPSCPLTTTPGQRFLSAQSPKPCRKFNQRYSPRFRLCSSTIPATIAGFLATSHAERPLSGPHTLGNSADGCTALPFSRALETVFCLSAAIKNTRPQRLHRPPDTIAFRLSVDRVQGYGSALSQKASALVEDARYGDTSPVKGFTARLNNLVKPQWLLRLP